MELRTWRSLQQMWLELDCDVPYEAIGAARRVLGETGWAHWQPG